MLRQAATETCLHAGAAPRQTARAGGGPAGAPLRAAQQPRGRLHGLGRRVLARAHGRQAHGLQVQGPSRRQLPGRHRRHEHVRGQVHVRGAGAPADGRPDGGGERGRDVAGRPRARGELGERPHRGQLVQLLEAALAQLALRRAQPSGVERPTRATASHGTETLQVCLGGSHPLFGIQYRLLC